jgi:hypothetical protein
MSGGGGGVARLQFPSNPPNQNLKERDFVDSMLSNIWRDLPFVWNQSLKLADD